jgi:hypothetical protein
MSGLIDVPRLLVAVTVCAVLAVPTVCAVNVRVAGAKVKGRTEVPFTSRTWELTVAVSLMMTPPLRFPEVPRAGVNVTLRPHVAAALRTRFAAQGVALLPVAAKSPLAEMDEMVSELALVFFTVMFLAALVVPTAWLAKVIVAGVNVSGAVEPPEPVPVSAISCGEKDVPLVTETAPLIAPFSVGVNVAAILQVAFEARVAPHVVPVVLIA